MSTKYYKDAFLDHVFVASAIDDKTSCPCTLRGNRFNLEKDTFERASPQESNGR